MRHFNCHFNGHFKSHLGACLLFIAACSGAPEGGPELSPDAAGPAAAMGMMVGEVTADGALVQVRLTERGSSQDPARPSHDPARPSRDAAGLVDGDVAGAPGVVEFSIRLAGRTAFAPHLVAMTQLVEARAEWDFIARASFTGLRPGTRYHVRSRIGSSAETLEPGPDANFKTLPGRDRTDPVRFVVVTWMN